MDGAWIAVIGTLGGVVVTAASALAVSIVTTRSQRATADRQIAVGGQPVHQPTLGLAHGAASGEREKYENEKAEGKQLRHELRAAMRAELNV